MIRTLCWLTAAFSAAVFLAVYLLPEPLLLPAGCICALGIALSLLFQGKNRKRIALLFAGIALGFLWTACYGFLFRTPARSLAEDKATEYVFLVTDHPSSTTRGASIPAELLTDSWPHPKVTLYADESAMELRPGDRITANVRLASSSRLTGGSFDFYESKGIYLLGYVRGNVTLTDRPDRIPLRFLPQTLSHKWKETISRIYPEDVAGFLIALTMGDKASLPAGEYAAFQRSGISHVVAVSGLHITFLAALLIFLFGKRSKWTVGLCIPVMFLYAAAAGNSPSALRSAIMTSILFLAPLLGREDDKPTTLSSVLALLLFIRPYSAASVSLQLSFAAVAGIYLLSAPLSSRWLQAIPKWTSRPGKLLHAALAFLASTLAVSLGALLFTAPLGAIHFHSVSLVGLLTNLLTLWAVSAAFFCGLIVIPLGILSVPLGTAAAWAAAWPARWVIWTSKTISRWPYASLSLLTGYLAGWFVLAYCILLFYLLFRRSIRFRFPAAAIVLTLLAAMFIHAYPSASGMLTVTALDVGQGASTLLYSLGHAVLVDCGGSGLNDAGDTAADYLQSLGVSHLDALILTHYHSDHANGVPELLARVDVDWLFLPDVTPDEELRQKIISLGQRYGCNVELLYAYDAQYTFGDAVLTIYTPLGDGGTNEEGLSVLCTAGAFDALITGDMNSVVEQRLIKYKPLPDIELLLVGHHGSKSSTAEELLSAVRPEQAIISVGTNSYGHPADETLERLVAAGCDIYRTDWMGTVTIVVSDMEE